MPFYSPLRSLRCSKETFGVSWYADCAMGRATSVTECPLTKNDPKYADTRDLLPDFSVC
jgi:hypothetical protein